MQHQKFRPTYKNIKDFIENLPLEIVSPKRNIAILRAERKSFTIFLNRNSNDIEKLKEFMYDYTDLDPATIDGRIDILLQETEGNH